MHSLLVIDHDIDHDISLRPQVAPTSLVPNSHGLSLCDIIHLHIGLTDVN